MFHQSQPPAIDSLFALGEYLRDVREAQYLSVEEVTARLHIRAMYLRALEAGNWSELPGQIYGRGYLRQYAEFLGLPTDALMQRLEAIQGKPTTRLHYFETDSTEQLPHRHTLWWSLLGILLLLLGWYLWHRGAESESVHDFALPVSLRAYLNEEPLVTPSSYPPAAEECLKLMQRAEIPCYWKQPLKMMPMLAYRLDSTGIIGGNPFLQCLIHSGLPAPSRCFEGTQHLRVNP
jgi:transcriptional regulator with XRE-family HTH domain